MRNTTLNKEMGATIDGSGSTKHEMTPVLIPLSRPQEASD
jgi:hypothetical protein